MDTANILLATATDEQLLLELLERNGYKDGPKKTVLECLVGIGKDHTASIILSKEAKAYLSASVIWT